jgi:hypothetical protein
MDFIVEAPLFRPIFESEYRSIFLSKHLCGVKKLQITRRKVFARESNMLRSLRSCEVEGVGGKKKVFSDVMVKVNVQRPTMDTEPGAVGVQERQ